MIDPEHIHDRRDVEVSENGYWCKRCGHTTDDRVEMFNHYRGLPSDCFIYRAIQWVGRRL